MFFSLFNRIAASDFAGSLEILQKIMLGNETNTVQLLGGLMWQLRNLQGIATELNNGESFQSACYKKNIRGKKAQAVYSEALKHYNEKNLQDIIKLTADYDIKLRTGKGGTARNNRTAVSLFAYCPEGRTGNFTVALTP